MRRKAQGTRVLTGGEEEDIFAPFKAPISRSYGHENNEE